MKSYLRLLCACLLACSLLPHIAISAPLSDQPLTESSSAVSGSSKRTFLDSADQDNILSPDEAFKLSLHVIDANTLEARFRIAPGHYLYRDRIAFNIKSGDATIAAVQLPDGEAKQDATFGMTQVYHRNITAIILLTTSTAAPAHLSIAASYQGCSEKGLCYSPIHKTLEVDLQNTDSAGNSDTDDNDSVTTLLKSGKLWLIVSGFFGFGLLLSLTPCVLPMIPILSGIIIGGKQAGRWHSFNLSLAYTLGMAVSYTLAGIAAGLSGELLSNALQNAWVLGTSALIFVALALSMFGFYTLKLPGSLENRLVKTSYRFKGGRFAGVFVMGAISALIVSPCVAAPLAGALLYISQTHDVWLGGIALFALSIGMGIPLLLVGASAGKLLPKAGPWMTAIRQAFGVLMLAMAIWLISPLISLQIQMLLWAALLIVPAVYMGAFDRSANEPTSQPTAAKISQAWARFWRGIAIMMLVAGIALIVGALSGARSMWQPLANLAAPVTPAAFSTASPAPSLDFVAVKNLDELQSRIDNAGGRTVMLDFYADWCVACKEMEQFTFSDVRVRAALKNAVLLRADITRNTPEDVALLKRFGLFGPPGILFFAQDGKELQRQKVIGYQSADQFLQHLRKTDTGLVP